ncbi:MAG: tetratricopeptide repeat protein [Candidatus Gygaella obscura]|nr:tetratricopeptide repeat protein [Candidatus Gygaella obscura]
MVNKKIFLIENHDSALKVWKDNRIKCCNLVHIDAHIDWNFIKARPLKRVLKESCSLKELKTNLEYSYAYLRYDRDFNKQVNEGNYIFQAFEEGIVKDFFWVIPGDKKIFKDSSKIIRGLLLRIGRFYSKKSTIRIDKKSCKAEIRFNGRKIVFCTLDGLDFINRDVLLDIDIDFLVIKSIKRSLNIQDIGTRQLWINPEKLIVCLKSKIRKFKIATIAYSVNGGWTPIKYRYLADEIAYWLSPDMFKKRFDKSKKAAGYFKLFLENNKKEFYQKAIIINNRYRSDYNNYGPLYFEVGKYNKAEKEFGNIIKADPNNAGALLGLGLIALARKENRKARKLFLLALSCMDNELFGHLKTVCLLALSKTELILGNLISAKEKLFHLIKQEPFVGMNYFYLGEVFKKQKNFSSAVEFYKKASLLGYKSLLSIKRIVDIFGKAMFDENVLKYIKLRMRKLKTQRVSYNVKDRNLVKYINKKLSFIESRLSNN